MVEIEGVDPQMILSNLKPNYVTHPGEVIMDEIEYLQIRQKDFAERIGVSASLVNQILKGKRPVNPEFAIQVGRILELNPEHPAVQAM